MMTVNPIDTNVIYNSQNAEYYEHLCLNILIGKKKIVIPYKGVCEKNTALTILTYLSTLYFNLGEILSCAGTHQDTLMCDH